MAVLRQHGAASRGQTAGAFALAPQVLRCIEGRVSPMNAASLFKRAVERLGITPERLEARQLPALVAVLSAPLRLYLSQDDTRGLLDEISGLGGERPSSGGRVEIQAEADVSRARQQARAMATALGGSSFVAQRVATAVSELARNIHAYTPGGTIEFETDAARRTLHIRAIDRGPGIDNLDAIMSGGYRSRTGMGLGLRGTKRLVDDMRIETGTGGTRIEAEVLL